MSRVTVPAGLTPEQAAYWQRRYGAARRTPVALLAVVGLFVVAFLGWVVWAAFLQADQQVRWRTTSFRDVTDSSVTVVFDVFTPAGTSVTCLVRAVDADGVEVGRAEVPVTVTSGDASVTYVLRTTELPTGAEVTTCRVAP